MHDMDGEPSTSSAGKPKPGQPMRPPAQAHALAASVEEEEEENDEELYMAQVGGTCLYACAFYM